MPFWDIPIFQVLIMPGSDFELNFEDPPVDNQDVDSDSESAYDEDPKFVPSKAFYMKLTGIIERRL